MRRLLNGLETWRWREAARLPIHTGSSRSETTGLDPPNGLRIHTSNGLESWPWCETACLPIHTGSSRSETTGLDLHAGNCLAGVLWRETNCLRIHASNLGQAHRQLRHGVLCDSAVLDLQGVCLGSLLLKHEAIGHDGVTRKSGLGAMMAAKPQMEQKLPKPQMKQQLQKPKLALGTWPILSLV